MSLAIWEASRQAESLSPRASRPVKAGMKADPSAPPATSRKSVSETRLAKKKASSCAEAPNSRATMMPRTRPAIWPKRMANITVAAARAIWRVALVGLDAVMEEDYKAEAIEQLCYNARRARGLLPAAAW